MNTLITDSQFTSALKYAEDYNSQPKNIQWAYKKVYQDLEQSVYRNVNDSFRKGIDKSSVEYQNLHKLGAALASNSNTSLNILLDLAKRYPNEFLNNVALDLHLLKDPSLFQEMIYTRNDSLNAILKASECPEEFIFNVLNAINSYLNSAYHKAKANGDAYMSNSKAIDCRKLIHTVLEFKPLVWNKWKEVQDNSKKQVIFPPIMHFHNLDLTNINFSNAHIEYANFADGDIEKTDFTGCTWGMNPRFYGNVYIGKNPTILEWYKAYKIGQSSRCYTTGYTKKDLIREADRKNVSIKKTWAKEIIALELAKYDFQEKYIGLDEHEHEGYPSCDVTFTQSSVIQATIPAEEELKNIINDVAIVEIEVGVEKEPEEELEEEVEEEVEDIDAILNNMVAQDNSTESLGVEGELSNQTEEPLSGSDIEGGDKLDDGLGCDAVKELNSPMQVAIEGLKAKHPNLVVIEVWVNTLFLRMSKGRCILAKKDNVFNSVKYGESILV
jgi:hypothetical protein